MSRPPRREASIASTTHGDPVRRRDTYEVDINGVAMRVHHGTMVLVGTEEDRVSRAATVVSIAVGIAPCDCGCGHPGRAIEFLPTPEHARMLARQLIEAADEVDAAAAIAASALITRARRA